MTLDSTKRELFQRAFRKKNAEDASQKQEVGKSTTNVLQNFIKNNKNMNQSIDGRTNNSNNLKEISIGNNQTDQPPFNFNVDLEDDGSGKIKGEFTKEINPHLDVGAFYETKVGENTGDDYGLSANYKNKIFNLDVSYGKGNNINANANFDYKF